jgi:hypothetical protein
MSVNEFGEQNLHEETRCSERQNTSQSRQCKKINTPKKRAREIKEPAKRPKERLIRLQCAFDATAFGEEGIHETLSGLAKRLSPVKMSRENCWSKRAFGETSLRRSDLVSYYPSDGDRMCQYASRYERILCKTTAELEHLQAARLAATPHRHPSLNNERFMTSAEAVPAFSG